MKLGDVELQQATGFLIAKGFLKVESETEMVPLGVGAHNHLLLSSRSNITTVWPATRITRDEHGFCHATLGEAGLAFWSLSLDDMGQLSPPEGGRRSLTRGGSQAGSLTRRVRLGDQWIEKRGGPIHQYELGTDYGPEGLHIAISGQVGVAEDGRGKAFLIEATVPWPALIVKGFRFAGAYWKFGHRQGWPSKLESPNRARDSRKLNDVLIVEGLTWPYLKGQILFTPEPSWPPPIRQSTRDFVSIHFENDQIGFWDARRLEVLDTGFARSDALSRHLIVAMFDRGKLEGALRQRNAISIQLAGNALGSVRYQTGYAEEFGDPLGWINQTIKTMSLRMALGKDGLWISADGELDDFDPVEFAEHREKRNSQLKPLRAYCVQATMPWALLVAREFSFAYRAREF
jgi:hypothetical protein